MADDMSPYHALLVKERLHELEMAYCRGIDRRDVELVKSIYFDDAVEDHGDAWKGSGHEWAEHAIGYVADYVLTCHYVMNESYAVDGDRAEGEVHRISYHRTAAGGEMAAASRTFNRYEKRDGVWKIAFRGVTRDWLRDARPPVPSDGAEDFLHPSSSRPGPDDALYSWLTLFPRGSLD